MTRGQRSKIQDEQKGKIGEREPWIFAGHRVLYKPNIGLPNQTRSTFKVGVDKKRWQRRILSNTQSSALSSWKVFAASPPSRLPPSPLPPKDFNYFIMLVSSNNSTSRILNYFSTTPVTPSDCSLKLQNINCAIKDQISTRHFVHLESVPIERQN